MNWSRFVFGMIGFIMCEVGVQVHSTSGLILSLIGGCLVGWYWVSPACSLKEG